MGRLPVVKRLLSEHKNWGTLDSTEPRAELQCPQGCLVIPPGYFLCGKGSDGASIIFGHCCVGCSSGPYDSGLEVAQDQRELAASCDSWTSGRPYSAKRNTCRVPTVCWLLFWFGTGQIWLDLLHSARQQRLLCLTKVWAITA